MENERTVTYADACRYIDGIVRFADKHPAEHTKKLLKALGNPERAFPIVHVAGTNGKGSVCACLEAVCRAAGMRTALFTSPHLVRINERFRIGGEEIPDETFLKAFLKVRRVCREMEKEGISHPSYFEFLFLMGMVCFAEEAVQICILETGLGGRLDATNTVEHPLISVITSVSLDHMQYLGGTIAEIAGEKAGIIKKDVPCVYCAENEEVTAVIAEACRSRGAAGVPVGTDAYEIRAKGRDGIDFSTAFRYDGNTFWHIGNIAPYQVQNAAVAIRTLCVLHEKERLFADLTAADVQKGIAGFFWPGRMEEIRPSVYLDGAHNEDGIRKFADAIRDAAGEEPVGLLFAVVSDKNYEGMISYLARSVKLRYVVLTEIAGERKTDARRLAELFGAYTDNVFICKNSAEALKLAEQKREEGLLFICGSLYLVGEIKEMQK
ncbi:MAG: folylpolyglutamate synthase/dihydrofolate synthase family protein [Lachnospiraceae bacterium]|nr:folylpolyglutamate synthase/dihydrofolate synthase family protein [Lachnospiraceae bacterium]